MAPRGRESELRTDQRSDVPHGRTPGESHPGPCEQNNHVTPCRQLHASRTNECWGTEGHSDCVRHVVQLGPNPGCDGHECPAQAYSSDRRVVFGRRETHSSGDRHRRVAANGRWQAHQFGQVQPDRIATVSGFGLGGGSGAHHARRQLHPLGADECRAIVWDSNGGWHLVSG